MAGIIAVYGLVVAVLIAGGLGPPPQKTYSLYTYVIYPYNNIYMCMHFILTY